MISLSVSAMTSATERLHSADDRIDRLVNMLEMRAEAEDRAAQIVAAVDPRTAQHHPALLLDVLDQAFVEIVDVPAFGQVAESSDGQLRHRPASKPSISDRRAWK